MGVTYQDYYKILGVDRTATEKEVKTAYRKLARQWHPDLHSGKGKAEAEEKFKLINEAYEVLKDPAKRAKYDQLGSNWRNGQDFNPPPDMDGFQYYTNVDGDMSGFSDFFESLFGGTPFGGRQGRRSARRTGSPVRMRGQDLETEMEITLEEAYRGGEKSIRLSGAEICSACSGTGVSNDSFCSRCGGTGTVSSDKNLSVKIPPGIRDGSRIRLKNQGGEGANGGEKGDLYLKIRLQPHPFFKVQGTDLETEVTIRPDQAVLGGEVTVPTLDGTVTMKLPAGIRSGKRLRLKGKGLPDKEGRGDEYVRIRMDLPDHISAEEQELYRKLAELRKGV